MQDFCKEVEVEDSKRDIGKNWKREKVRVSCEANWDLKRVVEDSERYEINDVEVLFVNVLEDVICKSHEVEKHTAQEPVTE